MTITIQKVKLRKLLKQRRLSINHKDAAIIGRKITDSLISEIDWKTIKSVHTYVPIRSLNEVDSWPLLDFIWQSWPSIITAVPAVQTIDRSFSLLVNPSTSWSFTKNTPLPVPRVQLSNETMFDLIIVPLLGYDEQCHRVGFGGGYYDRFLSKQPSAISIGLGYECSMVREGIPIESHDIALNQVITEDRIIRRPNGEDR